jgi:hypothetical protein
MKHQKILPPFNHDFLNTAYVYINDIDMEEDPTIVEASIHLFEK